MSFDTIRLPATTIADLYRQSLVVVDDVQQTRQKNKPQPGPVAVPPTSNPAIRYTGGFGKQISIVINYSAGAELPLAESEMLQKLLTACKLVPADYAIINIALNQPAAQELWQLMPARAMLLLGANYEEVGIPFTRAFFQVEKWNEAWLMSAPPLSQFLGPDTTELKALKRELWNGLQKIFLGK